MREILYYNTYKKDLKLVIKQISESGATLYSVICKGNYGFSAFR